MVHVLIALRRTIVRHQLARTNPAALLVGAVLVFISALGTIWLGLVSYPDPGAATDVLALLFLLWLGGRVAQSALAGDAVLRPEVFSLLPLERRRLAFGLLVVGLADPAGLFIAVAFAAVIARGARVGIGPAAVGLAAVILSLVLASVLSTVAGAALGPGSRRGHDTGTIVTAVAISMIAVAGTLLPALDAALRRGSVPWLATVLVVLPTGWGPVAVQAAGSGDWLMTAGALAGLAAVTVAVALWWPLVLTRRMDAAARPAHAGASRQSRWSALPRNPVGAVAAKEIRMWVRDPVRLTCLLIAVAPYTVAVTIAFTALSGDRASWPWALVVLPAVLGGAAGLAPFASLVSVQPLDETGNPTPAWSLKIHVALVVVALTAIVPVAILLAARLWSVPWLSWVAVPVGIASGASLAVYLGRRAVGRLESQQVRVLRVLADAAR